jgi:four helix bundle protein
MKDFRTLGVWQKAHVLTLAVYLASETFPRDEVFGLTSQIRRASVSIPANIAEGCGRQGDPEFSRFLQMAMGSASELEYELLLARDLHYIKEDAYGSLSLDVIELKRMLAALILKVRNPKLIAES